MVEEKSVRHVVLITVASWRSCAVALVGLVTLVYGRTSSRPSSWA